eukprot:scaffold9886_cov105-Isochrysis_galbana.AAC.2
MAAQQDAGRDRADARGGGVVALVLRGLLIYLAVGLVGRFVLRPLRSAAGAAPHQSSHTPVEAELAGAIESRARFRGGLAAVHTNAWPPLAPLEMRVYLSDSPWHVFPSDLDALAASRVEPSRGGGGEGGGGGTTALLDVLSTETLSRGVLVALETGMIYGSADGSDCSRQIDISFRTTAEMRQNRTSVWAHVYVLVARDGDGRGAFEARGGGG